MNPGNSRQTNSMWVLFIIRQGISKVRKTALSICRCRGKRGKKLFCIEPWKIALVQTYRSACRFWSRTRCTRRPSDFCLSFGWCGKCMKSSPWRRTTLVWSSSHDSCGCASGSRCISSASTSSSCFLQISSTRFSQQITCVRWKRNVKLIVYVVCFSIFEL